MVRQAKFSEPLKGVEEMHDWNQKSSRWSCFNLAAVFWWPLCPAGYTKQGRQPNCYPRVTPKDIFKRVNAFLEVS